MSVTAIVPTYNRKDALAVTLPAFLALRGVERVIVVDDCSTDGTYDYLRSYDDPRLVVIRHESNRGSPAARNSGARRATTPWVVFLEDDCGFPEDYAETLLAVAERESADVVAAPWVNVPEESYAAEVARRRAAPVERFTLDTHPGSFPPRTIETPFLCALALVRREVVLDLGYDESLRGNAWREETDFYLRAVEAGHRCVLTPETASWQAGHWGGGQHGPALAYERWLLRNNWRFLRRHRTYLETYGGVDAIAKAQARLAARRGYLLARRAGGAVKRAVRR